MPELPEVEVVRQGLDRGVTGRRLREVQVHHPRAVRRHAEGPADFAGRLVGATVVAARRRGKYLWLVLDTDEAVLGHLGMSGQLLVVPPDSPDQTHLRLRFSFDPDPSRTGADADADAGAGADRELRFVDQRTFGGLAVTDAGPTGSDPLAATTVPPPIAHIAADPLEAAFEPDRVRCGLRRRRTGIKRALLDQTLLSGIGNIYADEALWRARLHYARPTETLTRPEVDRLLAAVDAVLREALAAGGTSFDALYVSVEGVSGLFERSLSVYGREGRPCPRCGTPVRREKFMNRSSHVCPRCQPRPRRARW